MPHTRANDKRHHFKECTKCGETKRLADFHKRHVPTNKYRASDPRKYKNVCAECSRAPSAIVVDPNFKPDRTVKKKKRKQTDAERRVKQASYKRRKRRDTRIKALEYLADKGCCECGNRDPRVLEFDHVDQGSKDVCVGKLLSDGFGWGAEALRAEIRKCRVICANCHRLHTARQMEYYGHDDVRDALRTIDERYSIEQQD